MTRKNSQLWADYWARKQAGGQNESVPKDEEGKRPVQDFIHDSLKEALVAAAGRTRFSKKLGRKHRVLEIGAGPGALSRELKTRLGVRMVAIDPSRSKAVEGMRVRRQRAETLKFPDNHFSAVVSAFTLDYTHKHKALRELARVLKDDGHAVLFLHSRSSNIAMTVNEDREQEAAELEALHALRKHVARGPFDPDLKTPTILRGKLNRLAEIINCDYRDLAGESAAFLMHSEWAAKRRGLADKSAKPATITDARRDMLARVDEAIVNANKQLSRTRMMDNAMSRAFWDEKGIERALRKQGLEAKKIIYLPEHGFGVIARKAPAGKELPKPSYIGKRDQDRPRLGKGRFVALDSLKEL